MFKSNSKKSKNDVRIPVRTRIAPSPTGPLHVGTARTALFNFLFAKKYDGQFLLRIEDTDKVRSKPEYEKNIIDSLDWLGIRYDEFSHQSDRTKLYKQYLEKLIEENKAFISTEPSKNDPNKTVNIIRLRNENKPVTFHDIVRDDITFDTSELGDFVIARNMEEPLYNLTVVIDDYEMNISHVIRGEDHISNTSRQILIQQALGFSRPEYAHLPLILARDRSKLSKRAGAVSIEEYKDEFLPSAFVNYLALLGWNPGTEQEIFAIEELIEQFDLDKIQKGGAIFNREKLRSINHAHLKLIPQEELLLQTISHLPGRVKQLPQFSTEVLENILPLILERTKTYADLRDSAESGEWDYFFTRPHISRAVLPHKDTKLSLTKEYLHVAQKRLTEIQEDDFTKEKVKETLWEYATHIGRAQVLWPMRVALSGKEQSADPFTIAEIIGQSETLARLAAASDTIEE